MEAHHGQLGRRRLIHRNLQRPAVPVLASVFGRRTDQFGERFLPLNVVTKRTRACARGCGMSVGVAPAVAGPVAEDEVGSESVSACITAPRAEGGSVIASRLTAAL